MIQWYPMRIKPHISPGLPRTFYFDNLRNRSIIFTQISRNFPVLFQYNSDFLGKLYENH